MRTQTHSIRNANPKAEIKQIRKISQTVLRCTRCTLARRRRQRVDVFDVQIELKQGGRMIHQIGRYSTDLSICYWTRHQRGSNHLWR